MDERERRQLLKDEYLHLQRMIEDFDARALTIKAWSVSFSMAAIGGAYASDSEEVLSLAAVSALLFWLIEGFWKTFQYAHYERSGRLERYFAGEGNDIDPMQIGSSWFRHWKKGGVTRLLRILCWPHVALPHAAVVLIAVVLLALHFARFITV